MLNACEGARTSGRDAFSGVAQALVRQGLPAVVAMQTEISDKAALVFSHEFYYFTRGLPIDAAICEVRKAMATSDEVSEWGTAVLVRVGSDQPFDVSALGALAEARPRTVGSLYAAATSALASSSPQAAVPILERIAAERPDYADASQLLEQVQEPSPRERAGQGVEANVQTDVQTDVEAGPHVQEQRQRASGNERNENGRNRRGGSGAARSRRRSGRRASRLAESDSSVTWTAVSRTVAAHPAAAAAGGQRASSSSLRGLRSSRWRSSPGASCRASCSGPNRSSRSPVARRRSRLLRRPPSWSAVRRWRRSSTGSSTTGGP